MASPDPFQPLAITAVATILPGALDAAQLWRAVLAGQDLCSRVPAGRWGLDPAAVLARKDEGASCDRGGYVQGFAERFDPSGLQVDPTRLRGLDPLFHWVCDGVRQCAAGLRDRAQTGLVLGNLSYPTEAMARLVALDALGRSEAGQALRAALPIDKPDAMDRFMSGLPAILGASANGLGLGGFAIDAACASGLYALKLAADRLHDGEADAMIAGGVCRADDLFLHVGFTALGALSKTGQSRPFHAEADGLLPAEGAVFVTLRRLADARADGDPILGVVRGVGLSNDGRGSGLLVPTVEGQRRAVIAAYEMAGLEPADVTLLECHATGTMVGDRTELETLSSLWQDPRRPAWMGSLKGNLGHLITAAGLAGLVKVLGALEHGVMPPTRGADRPIAPLDHDDGPLRLLHQPRPWTGPRRAGISAFGFGGNNAHLIVERGQDLPFVFSPRRRVPVAVVSMGTVVGDAIGNTAFTAAVLRDEPPAPRTEQVSLPLTALRFPPNELRASLGQQTLTLQAAFEAHTDPLPRERTAVMIGMGTDPTVARYGLRWHLDSWFQAWRADHTTETPDWADSAKAAVTPALTSAGVVGAMPNVVANRLNRQLDLGGPGFTVSAEQASGPVALSLAIRALQAHEIDAAVVGAVDLGDDEAHGAALRALTGEQRSADAAVVWVLRRLDDVQDLGLPVLGVLDECSFSGGAAAPPTGAHAASGLVEMTRALTCVRHAVRPGHPWPGPRQLEVGGAALGGLSWQAKLRAEGPAVGWRAPDEPGLECFAAESREALIHMLQRNMTGTGPVRLAIVAPPAERQAARERALASLLAGRDPWGDGIFYRATPLNGELAFVFAGAARPESGMGAALLAAFPRCHEAVSARLSRPERAWDLLYPSDSAPPLATPAEQMVASSALAQAHAVFSQEILGLRPTATLGYSLGESNMLHALGLWQGAPDPLDAMMNALVDGPLFTTELTGPATAVRAAWRAAGFPSEAAHDGPLWDCATVGTSRAAAEAALAQEPLIHVMLVNTPDELVLGGWPPALRRVLSRLRAPAFPLGYPLAVHCPEVRQVAEDWRRFHHRPAAPTPGLRVYSGAWGRAYAPDTETCADALLAHAVGTLDFAALVERAWQDGVRIFVEHGPRGLCSGWIRRTLGDRPHLAVALDDERPGLRAPVEAAAKLWVAGVEVQTAVFAHRPSKVETGPSLVMPAHAPPVRLPELGGVAIMRRDPEMPSNPTTQAPTQEVASSNPRVGTRVQGSTHPPDVTQTAAVHRQFLEAQLEVQQRFLAIQQAGTTALVAAARRFAATQHATPPAAAVPAAPPHPGPTFSRQDLIALSSGPISAVFGADFARQDGFRRQVRMPMPPLLLADRVTGISVPPGELRPGVIWTETDVTAQSWYLHQGRIPAGIMIEAGQADLLLISWLGIDLLNQGERVYRLLGCTAAWHGEAPKPGDTLCYSIHIDGFASHGDIRLFFFHYDCTVNGTLRLEIRGGQAGFFSDAELADSAGVLWDPETGEHDVAATMDAPTVTTVTRSLSHDALQRFGAGDVPGAFGSAYARAATHVRSPRIQSGDMMLLGEVLVLDPSGGPWGRGYLRAERMLSPDDWFFQGHFKDDPCMPGTLMFEGCIQAMAVWLTAMGWTLDRDGWRFQTVREARYDMRCRGQATPRSKKVVYELFIEEQRRGPRPTVFADVRVSVDGLAAFHCRRLGVELVPDWPLSTLPRLEESARAEAHGEPDPRFTPFGLLSSAWGRPSDAFGPDYNVCDEGRRAPRLPGPPYQFMSRVVSVSRPFGLMLPGHDAGLGPEPVEAVIDYEVPPDAWYFRETGFMPFAVLLEAALQPCGWLACWTGSALLGEEVFFRNLDGEGILHATIRPDVGTLRTRTRLTSLSRLGPMILVNFAVDVTASGAPVFAFTTSFGFFPAEALARQAGLPIPPQEPGQLTADGRRFWTGEAAPALSAGVEPDDLSMLHRSMALAESPGQATLRGEHDVNGASWFFKAHFFDDPVQPGSLGVSAMLELLERYARDVGIAGKDESLPVLTGETISWKYRGQVRPHNQAMAVLAEVETSADAVRGTASLWVDGARIYEAKLGVGRELR